MRIAILGDVHLIADDDPHSDFRLLRSFFHDGVPAFRRTIAWLDTLGLDAVICVGDLIDWHSEENVAFAVDVMSGLTCPWHLTPGNHDLQYPKAGIQAGTYDLDHPDAHRAEAIACWRRHGVDLSDRRVAIDGHDLLLVDSASNRISGDTMTWLNSRRWSRPLLVSHVPLDRPLIRTFILGTELRLHFDADVLVQALSPTFFADCVAARIPTVITGHLHVSGTLAEDGTTFHLLDGSFAKGPIPPSVAIVEAHGDEVQVTLTPAPV